ncbi:MAG TPA: SDR family NAD(P)-dependent oxidoreductase, partial [Mycobacteriales bacterium]|nr:SDR family NAD(P)-dependent oxidoreductase [Mycobacteriales bacterium]
MAELDGRVALITGAASGIGAACAETLAAAGARVLLLDRDEKVHEAARALGGDALVVDLTDTAAVAGLELAADIVV